MLRVIRAKSVSQEGFVELLTLSVRIKYGNGWNG